MKSISFFLLVILFLSSCAKDANEYPKVYFKSNSEYNSTLANTYFAKNSGVKLGVYAEQSENGTGVKQFKITKTLNGNVVSSIEKELTGDEKKQYLHTRQDTMLANIGDIYVLTFSVVGDNNLTNTITKTMIIK